MEEGVALFERLGIVILKIGVVQVLCCIVIVGGLVSRGCRFHRRFLRRIVRGNRISFSDLYLSCQMVLLSLKTPYIRTHPV